MKLTTKQIKSLRSLGHNLSPIVTVADKGLTENVILAIEEALDIHELVKVKIRQDREQRTILSDQICKKTGALEVQKIGMMLLIFKPAKQSKINLPGPKLKA